MQQDVVMLGFLPNVGWPEMLVIGVVLLLLFGRRLPEVGKSLGQGIVQFKKGLKDVQREVEDASEPERYESARPPLTSAGTDARVSHSDADPGDAAAPTKQAEAG
ncbi:MAG: twin-arginine translocase TatA/TatE family subunit [Planctomycetota bacterium]